MNLLVSYAKLLRALNLHSSEGEVVAAFWCTRLSMLLDWVDYILQ